MLEISNYIGGEFVAPASGEYLDNFEPATGEVYSLIPDSDDRDVHLAAEAARAAFPAWSQTPAEGRFEILMRIVALIERDLEALALAESIDNGKPLTLARSLDIPRAASNFRFYATAAMHTANESHETAFGNNGDAINYTLRQPLGVVGCISPWNLPLYLFTLEDRTGDRRRLHGRREAERVTPMTAYLLVEALHRSRLAGGRAEYRPRHRPEGRRGDRRAHGREERSRSPAAPRPAKRSPASRHRCSRNSRSNSAARTRTSSLPTAITRRCSRRRVRSSFANQGEICLCGSRIFVERPIYERFKNDFVARVSQLKVGDPLDAGHRRRGDRFQAAFRQDNVVHRPREGRRRNDPGRRRKVRTGAK